VDGQQQPSNSGLPSDGPLANLVPSAQRSTTAARRRGCSQAPGESGVRTWRQGEEACSDGSWRGDSNPQPAITRQLATVCWVLARAVLASLRPDGRIDHADVRIGDSLVMLSEASEQYPARSCVHYVHVPDVDATYVLR
jgi:hypothetical protein